MSLLNEINATTSSSSAWATGGYIQTYTPAATTSASYVASVPSITFSYKDPDMVEKIEKLEKHIDELEEDIEYFNNKLDDQAGILKAHEKCINDNYTINAEQDKQIEALKEKVVFLENYTNYLEGRIMALEDKLNDKMS